MEGELLLSGGDASPSRAALDSSSGQGSAVCRTILSIFVKAIYSIVIALAQYWASFFVGIEFLNVCREMFSVGLFYKAENKTQHSPA